ncbi:MAG TPA: hypothetical protein ENK43_01625 [Planctomycetes bacterium]|nr:hypothetical protein [Planctomycetota bacterium]
MNVDEWISRLEGAEPRWALDRLRGAPPALARPAIPALLGLAGRSHRGLKNEALSLAIRLRPEDSGQITALLESLVEDVPGGWMLPDVVDAFEHLASRSEETIESLGKALSYPHARVRVAAARGLATLGPVLELVDRPLQAAMKDPAIEVRQAVFETLLENRKYLSAALAGLVTDRPQAPAIREVRESAERFENAYWRPRAAALNGIGDDGDDVVFCVRPRTEDERGRPDDEILIPLLSSHGLPAGKEALHRTTMAMSEHVWRKMIYPLFSESPVSSTPIEQIAKCWAGLFDRELRLYSNVVFEDGAVVRVNPVSGCLIDVGLVGIDDTRVGIFWVADED